MTASTIASYAFGMPRTALEQAAELMQIAATGTRDERNNATREYTLLICKWHESCRCCDACPYHCPNRLEAM